MKSTVLYCDGGHNNATGKVAYASVVDGDSKDMLLDNILEMEGKIVDLPVGRRRVLIANFSDVTRQQNNGAELIAFYSALVIGIRDGYKTINCDSDLLVKFWSKKITPKPGMDKRKLDFVKRVIDLRKEFERNGGEIVKIPGKDNLADLGYHR